MAERTSRRIYVPDVRGTDQYLRLTWHDEQRVVVLSHWDGSVCTAATRMGVEDASRVIAFLAGSLADAATSPTCKRTVATVPRHPWWRWWEARLPARWRRRPGNVVELGVPGSADVGWRASG